jgi:2-(1,2-epoxy-1,2-dihydrophenyl)acetyl-CoA isomerase
MPKTIKYETENGIAQVQFNRPTVRNALNDRLLGELLDVLECIEAADDVYAVVLTGNGPAFSAGGDIPAVQDWQSTDWSEFEVELQAFQDIVSQLRSMSTPSVAAVNGPAVGAGCDIALACDVRVVSPEAELIEGFVTIGLISGDGGAWLLPRLIGESRAKRYLLTGDPITAEAAVNMGLAVEQTDSVLDAATAFAERLRDLPRAAVSYTKEMATMKPESLEDHFDLATDAQWACLQDAEHRETLAARLDGRDPDLDRF